MESQLGLIEQSFNSRYSQWIGEALNELPDSFTISDPSISGHPIVFASHGFLKMSRFSREEVIGKNGRIFQGPRTNRRSVMEIREAIREERTVQISLLNYRKDGTSFWMLFHLSPVFSKEDSRVINFVAVQVPILRKPRRSVSGCRRNGVNFSEDGSRLRDSVIGSCRREVCSDSLLELSRVVALDSDSDSTGIEEPCEANDEEKQRAVAATNNILSVLTHYSELTGKLVSGERCSLPGAGLVSSSLNISLGRIKQSFVLTDTCLPDMPIVYASDAFLKLTGYARHEVLGRNCRFLSGVDTDPTTLFQIKESIRTEKACTVRILNYRKDKSSFWNLLHISPIRNASAKEALKINIEGGDEKINAFRGIYPHIMCPGIFRDYSLPCRSSCQPDGAYEYPTKVHVTKVAYFMGVQLEESCKNASEYCLSPEMRQLSAVGSVKVAVRSLSMGAGPSKS